MLDAAPDSAALFRDALKFVDEERYAEASERLDVAIAARPDFAEAFALGAFILERGGKNETALRFYQRALTLKPDQPRAWFNLAKLCLRENRAADAMAALDAGLAGLPGDDDALNTRSAALRSLGRLADSADAARAALKRRPKFPEAAVNLGAALMKSGQPGPGLDAFRMASRQRRDYADAICGEALCLRALGRLDKARAAFDRAVALGCREAISGRGCLDLMLGDFANGWEGYEARWVDGKSLIEALGVRYPLWKGPSAAPQRVLVINDHGLGDTIQFARYLPLMAGAGAEPHVLAPAKMHALIGPLAEGRIFAREPADLKFDAQIAISSLPRAFGTRLDSVPAPSPYLHSEADRVARWSQRLGGHGFKIGCVWQGNPNPEADSGRSFALAELAPLAGEGVRLISLQKGFGEEQQASFALERLGPEFDAGASAFLDAAAVMKSLDLVVTCDTSIAHLAGALGVPVWAALKKDAEWRWLRGRDDSPWYPTMRLFRQPRDDDWSAVFAQMARALRVLRISA